MQQPFAAPPTGRRAGSARRRTAPHGHGGSRDPASAWATTTAATRRGERGGFEDAGGDTPFPACAAAGAQVRGGGFGGAPRGKPPRGPVLIEGELVAKSTGAASAYGDGARVFHQKFGPGTVAVVDGNKLTVDFDKAGRKMVLDSFVQGAG